MNAQPTPSRLVPSERLSAITSLIAEGSTFEGHFQSGRDQGIKVDGHLSGNISIETGGTLHVGATGVIENTRLEADYVFIEGKVTGTVIARKALVLFQFILATILIVSTLVVYQQISFAMNQDLGYAKDQLIQITNE